MKALGLFGMAVLGISAACVMFGIYCWTTGDELWATLNFVMAAVNIHTAQLYAMGRGGR